MRLRTDEKPLGRFDYSPLFELLKRRGISNIQYLRANDITSSKPIAKIIKNEPISSTVIASICNHFNCQPCDIMEYIPPEQ